jgi:hypothetical protein
MAVYLLTAIFAYGKNIVGKTIALAKVVDLSYNIDSTEKRS